MRVVSVKMPDALVEAMDELVRRKVYPSRSAVLRTAVRDLLKKELWREARVEVEVYEEEEATFTRL